MGVEEKLVEIVKRAAHLCLPSNTKDFHLDMFVTDLIANGVTVRDVTDINVGGKWISVKDMPLEEYEYKTVLYYDGKNVDPCLVLNGKFIDIYTDCGRYIDGVTHLMPLPQPPKGG